MDQIPLLLVTLFFVAALLIIFLARTCGHTEGFETPAATLQASSDFKALAAFSATLCDTWNRVLTQVVQEASGTDSPPTGSAIAAYRASLETSTGKQFVSCATAISADTPLLALLGAIPTSPAVYQNTIQWMAKEIQNILEQTESALHPSAESFVDAGFHCTPDGSGGMNCLPIEPAPAPQIAEILKRAAAIAPALPSLSDDLAQVVAGLKKLDDYKQKAESGELLQSYKPAAGT